MSSFQDVPARLGEHMVQGWVLTDRVCSTSGCNTPLLRSPKGSQSISHICVSCDLHPPNTTPSGSVSSPSALSVSRLSTPSTPHTELSSTLSSPRVIPPTDSPETRRRREQSDAASSEISKRLLRGWAMLGEECPNNSCYGVPLVRPPKTEIKMDPRKECVLCGCIYRSEFDEAGRELLVITDPSSLGPTQSNTTALPDLKIPEIKGTTNPPRIPSPALSSGNMGLPQQAGIVAPAPCLQLKSGVSSCPVGALNQTAQALQATLLSLSAKLSLSSDSQALVNPASIGSIADAINKVTQALAHVRQLQWSENEAMKL